MKIDPFRAHLELRPPGGGPMGAPYGGPRAPPWGPQGPPTTRAEINLGRTGPGARGRRGAGAPGPRGPGRGPRIERVRIPKNGHGPKTGSHAVDLDDFDIHSDGISRGFRIRGRKGPVPAKNGNSKIPKIRKILGSGSVEVNLGPSCGMRGEWKEPRSVRPCLCP